MMYISQDFAFAERRQRNLSKFSAFNKHLINCIITQKWIKNLKAFRKSSISKFCDDLLSQSTRWNFHERWSQRIKFLRLSLIYNLQKYCWTLNNENLKRRRKIIQSWVKLVWIPYSNKIVYGKFTVFTRIQE